MEISYISKKDYVLVKTYTDLNKKGLVDMIRKSVNGAREHNCTNILFDHRNCRLEMKLTDLFNVTADVKVHGLTPEYTCAIIYDLDGDKYKFSEDVINNRNNPECRFFDDFEEGKDWLLAKKAHI